jgi:hypothetical protein
MKTLAGDVLLPVQSDSAAAEDLLPPGTGLLLENLSQ